MAEMSPADVPDELIAAGFDAIRAWWKAHPDLHLDDRTQMREVLAAVLLLHEQQVRERVASEIEAYAETQEWFEGASFLTEAAGIARGNAPDNDPALCCCQSGLMCPACNSGRHPRCPDWRGEREDDDA